MGESMKIELGEKVEDMVTGFKGIAISKIEFLNGCVQYGVKPKTKKSGEMSEVQYIDEEQLKRIGKGVKTKRTYNGGEKKDLPVEGFIG